MISSRQARALAAVQKVDGLSHVSEDGCMLPSLHIQKKMGTWRQQCNVMSMAQNKCPLNSNRHMSSQRMNRIWDKPLPTMRSNSHRTRLGRSFVPPLKGGTTAQKVLNSTVPSEAGKDKVIWSLLWLILKIHVLYLKK